MIATDLDLPFADAVDSTPAHEVDIAIRRGDVDSDPRPPTAHGPFWSIHGDQCLLTVPGVVKCLVADGRTITFEPAPGMTEADAAPFVTGTALGVLLHQRGLMALHASSVAVGDQAVLFCGPSGAGKSTMAAALTQHGFPLVSDDVCVVDFDGGDRPLVRPDGRLMRLWGRTVEALSLGEQRLTAVRPRLAKYFVAPHAEAIRRPYEIGAIYTLRASRMSTTAVTGPMNGAEATVFLRQSTYRPRYVIATRQQVRQFEQVTRIAGRVPVFELSRPMNLAAVSSTVDVLAAHWREIGLIEEGP